jgi:hypothetical protein
LFSGIASANFRVVLAEYLTTPREYDNYGAGFGEGRTNSSHCSAQGSVTRGKPPGEDGMDLEKDNFEEDNELSGLEEDDELGDDSGDVVEVEEEELIIGEEEPEEGAPAPAAKPAAKKPAKKAPAKKAKKPAPKAKAKAKAKPKAKKAAKKPAKKKKKR